MSETKITAKIYQPLLDRFNYQVNTLHIKRDSYLNAMIKAELPNLEQDLGGRKLCPKVKRYISGKLKKMGTKQVNIVVEKDVADRLNQIVEESNIVRDAFLNRLILFLRSSDGFLERMELPNRISNINSRSMLMDMPTSPLSAIQEVMNDPLYYLRHASLEAEGVGLYTAFLPGHMFGFTCYVDSDSILIPGTDEWNDFTQMSEILTQFESES